MLLASVLLVLHGLESLCKFGAQIHYVEFRMLVTGTSLLLLQMHAVLFFTKKKDLNSDNLTILNWFSKYLENRNKTLTSKLFYLLFIYLFF